MLLFYEQEFEKLSKILKMGGIHVASTPINTIRHMIDATKDQIDPSLHKGGYDIPWSYHKVCIGEKGRSMKVRFKEHNVDLSLNTVQKYSLVEHS